MMEKLVSRKQVKQIHQKLKRLLPSAAETSTSSMIQT
jgi:hypothetical protein